MMRDTKLLGVACLMAILVNVKNVSSLLCWRCESVISEEECTRYGTAEICQQNQACLTEWREANEDITLMRSCKQKTACETMAIYNLRTCKKYRRNLTQSICYDCCSEKDYCNAVHNDPDNNYKQSAVTQAMTTIATSTEASDDTMHTIQTMQTITNRKVVFGGLLIVNPEYFDEKSD
ncbi:uncharacterized protein LOC143465492 [Clavelina lepadiformis]|uniref:uncharacterized protein LOC143465492 n=1 Tax=Clavelina lepadiformis TaxID=159417 RepID=UPI0040430854